MKKGYLSSLLAAGLLAGCMVVPGVDQKNPTGSATSLSRVENAMKEEGVGIRLVRFNDARPASNTVPMVESFVMYEYDADNLFQGMNTRLPGIMKSYLEFNKTADTTYTMEVDLKHIRTYIGTGTLLTTRWGIYRAEVEIDVIARDSASQVIFQKSYASDFVKKRYAYQAETPDAALDRKNMLETAREALRRVSYQAASDIQKVNEKRRTASALAMELSDNETVEFSMQKD